MQYSIFNHGTALEVENPENLARVIKVGWGTQVRFKAPVPDRTIPGDIPSWAIEAPGSWFHMSLPTTLSTFGRRAPKLKSVTILFESENCSIWNVHVYDGANIIWEDNYREFVNLLRGSFLDTRQGQDVNPENPPGTMQYFPNTIELASPRKIFSTIGVSFFATSSQKDFPNRDPRNTNFPQATLTVAAVGGQFIVEDPLSLISPQASISLKFKRFTLTGSMP